MAGWLSRLLRRSQALPVEQIAAVAAQILDRVGEDRDAWRRELAKAAEAGDLDAPFEAYQAANRRARRYIKEG